MEEQENVGEETQPTQKLNLFLAFLAGFLAFGMGYVYVGRPRAGAIAFAGVFTPIAIGGWTRLMVYSAPACWAASAFTLIWCVVILIHPVVLAVKHRHIAKPWYKHWLSYVVWVPIGSAISFAIVTNRATIFGYEPFRVRSESMSPTIELGDFVMADTWRYRGHAPVVGDIVMVEKPGSHVAYVKRVVGVPGDSVELRDGVVYHNGFAIDEPFIQRSRVPFREPSKRAGLDVRARINLRIRRLPRQYLDSRQWGPLPISGLRGRTQFVYLSVDSESRVHWERVGTRLRP